MKGTNHTLNQLLTLTVAGLFTIGMTACGGGGGQSGSDGGSGNGESQEKEMEESGDGNNSGGGSEHPDNGGGGSEHPDDGGSGGGSEHPDESSKSQSMTIEQFADAAKAHGGSEHPDDGGGGSEHPDDGGSGGGSEHPDESSKSQSMTIEQFADAAKAHADAAKAHIEKEAKKHDGHFMVKDQKTGKKLKLDLEKVHRKRLSHLGDNRYFVCANFTSQDGTLYDVDIFMEGTKKSNLEEAGKPKVHKVEGEPRFTYYQEDGVWKRKSVDNNDQQASKS
jgi:hypothetical protein